MPKVDGFTYLTTWGKSPHATPAQKAAKRNATILVRLVSTVMALAAISLSRTALSAFPIVERTKLLMVHAHRTVQANTVGRLAQSGWPLKPRGPCTYSRFSIRLLTMNRNA